MTHVVCVGDLMVDVIAMLPGPLAPGSDTPARVRLTGGGAAANVAAWLVEAGAQATFVARVGDDPLGRQAVAELTAAGVRTAVTIDTARPTGTCIVLVDAAGERTMIPDAGANAGDELAALPKSAAWLYLSGYALLGSASRGAAARCVQHARERGWSVAVDVASAAPLAAFGPAEFLDLVGTDVLLFANADEARVLTGSAQPAEAAQALASRCGRAVVKCGAAGAVWSDGRDVRSVPARAATVVDSTGAGDAFAAGFLAANGTVEDQLAAGASLAARVVSQVGARPPRP